jgi:hypothetical protein
MPPTLTIASDRVPSRSRSQRPAQRCSSTATTPAQLHALGYTVTGTGMQTSVGPISETAVVYFSSAHLAQARRVLRSPSGTDVLAKGPTVDGADVTATTGTDLSVVGSEGAATITTSSTSVAHVSGTASAFANLVSEIVVRPQAPHQLVRLRQVPHCRPNALLVKLRSF